MSQENITHDHKISFQQKIPQFFFQQRLSDMKTQTFEKTKVKRLGYRHGLDINRHETAKDTSYPEITK